MSDGRNREICERREKCGEKNLERKREIDKKIKKYKRIEIISSSKTLSPSEI